MNFLVFLTVSVPCLAAEVRLGPAPGWYRPMRCALGEALAEPLAAQPTYLGSPVYGALTLGDGEDRTYTVVVDLAPDWEAFKQAYKDAQGKVDLQTVPARIYVDANNDEDLTNDGGGLLTGCSENPRAPGQFTIATDVRCRIVYADGAQVDYPLGLYMFPQRPKVKQSDGSEIDFTRTLFCHRNASFEARLPVRNARLAVRFYDENSDGLIALEDDDQVAIDLNRDGKLDESLKGPEMYALDEPFSFGGESYVLATFGSRGQKPRAKVSEEKVAEPVYLLPGEPAPDFTMPTLDGGTLKLSEQRGKVVVLDFWATWCGPCKAELPNVVKMWEDLKDEGLVIVGISLDGNSPDATAADTVRKFAAENGMTWTHIVEGKVWESAIGDLYQVSGIPQTFLLDREGRIIAAGLRGEQLHEAARRALGPG